MKEESFDMQGDSPEELQELAVLITLNSDNHATKWDKIEATASSKLKSFMSETQTRELRYKENPTIFFVPNHARDHFDCFRFDSTLRLGIKNDCSLIRPHQSRQ